MSQGPVVSATPICLGDDRYRCSGWWYVEVGTRVVNDHDREAELNQLM